MMHMDYIVMIVLAILCLIAVLLILSGSVIGVGTNVGEQSALKNCCQAYKANGCPPIWGGGGVKNPMPFTCEGKSIHDLAKSYSNAQLKIYCDCA